MMFKQQQKMMVGITNALAPIDCVVLMRAFPRVSVRGPKSKSIIIDDDHNAPN